MRAPAAGMPSAPPLPEDVEALLRQLRLPHIRNLAPDIVATAKAQRWEPIEVVKALFTENSPAGNAPPWPPDDTRTGSRPGKPSTPGNRRPPRLLAHAWRLSCHDPAGSRSAS